MKFEQFIYKLENPQVYTGREINAVKNKITKDTINICLVFPDKYEIGMSHYGLKILYHLLNKMPEVNAERCFLPGKKSIKEFYDNNFPLFSLENKLPLKKFDLVGFSLLSEMNYTNILQILDLAQIPLKRSDRSSNLPIIAAGGICAVNPEPLADFIDIFAVGDGEIIFPEIVGVLKRIKKRGADPKIWLTEFDKLNGIYVPDLFPVSKQGKFWCPDTSGRKIKKRTANNITNSIPDHKIIVPITNVIFDRLEIEIARGCPQNCRFCQAKSYYSPYRVKPVLENVQNISRGLIQTGFDAFSLSSLSSGDYPFLEELLENIPGIVPPCVSFSLPSLRPSTLSDQLLKTISQYRKTGLTIVPEAGTERLRKVINKNVDETEIIQALEYALANNWERIKIYFMIGLPSETTDDIIGIVELVERIVSFIQNRQRKMKIHLSFSSFVPKPHTPLQWVRRDTIEQLLEKMKMIRDRLKKYRFINLDFHQPYRGEVETILSRGDRRVGELILQAFKNGEIFSAWDSDFNFPVWKELMNSLELGVFLEAISEDELLPWDHIGVNFKSRFLKAEAEKARQAKSTQSCNVMNCHECAGCFFAGKINPDSSVKRPATRLKKPETGINYSRVRIFMDKKGDFSYFSQLSWLKNIERIIRKTGIQFKYNEGYHPRMKISSIPALPVFAKSFSEVVEVFIDPELSEADILDLLNYHSNGIQFKKVVICNHCQAISKDIVCIEYEFKCTSPGKYIKQLNYVTIDSDEIVMRKDRLLIKIDYEKNGTERFARIYRILDPLKNKTFNLLRKNVVFHHDH